MLRKISQKFLAKLEILIHIVLEKKNYIPKKKQ